MTNQHDENDPVYPNHLFKVVRLDYWTKHKYDETLPRNFMVYSEWIVAHYYRQLPFVIKNYFDEIPFVVLSMPIEEIQKDGFLLEEHPGFEGNDNFPRIIPLNEHHCLKTKYLSEFPYSLKSSNEEMKKLKTLKPQ
jgi:hypothetical protein